MKTTLNVGDYFGVRNRMFVVTAINKEEGVYVADWQGVYTECKGREIVEYYSPSIVFPIAEFERLNSRFNEEGVMAYLPKKMECDYRKNKIF